MNSKKTTKCKAQSMNNKVGSSNNNLQNMNQTIKHKQQSANTKVRTQIAKGKQNTMNNKFINNFY